MVKPFLPSEAKAAVKLLLKLKMIRKLDDGTYKQRDSVLVADSNVISLALQTFALSMIDHSKSALKDKNCKERHISSMTLGISSASYSLLAAGLRHLKTGLKHASRDENSNVVYQMFLALFSVSESIDSPEEMKAQLIYEKVPDFCTGIDQLFRCGPSPLSGCIDTEISFLQ